MKKFYTLGFCALFGIILAQASNGVASFQIDLNLGTAEPDLLDTETQAVTGEYENGLLTITDMIYGFAPIQFTINMETGEAIAADQIAVEEDGDEFYYYDVESKQPEVTGIVTNIGTDKCRLELQPWGPGNYFPGFGVFFNVVFYNTVINFDFPIPGLGVEETEAVLKIESVEYQNVDTEYGIYLEFTVKVYAEDIPEESDIEVYYKGPYDYDFKQAQETADGSFVFTMAALEPNQYYAVEVYAQAGNIVSETVSYSFRMEEAGVDNLYQDGDGERYYNMKGHEVKNPQPGDILIRRGHGKSEKIIMK